MSRHLAPSDDQPPKAWKVSTPTIWHGITLGRWLGLLSQNQWAISANRLPRALLLFPIATMNSLLTLLAKSSGDAISDAANLPQDPIFVIGHWRTGTTAMHELLLADPRHSSATTYQVMAPNHFWLSHKLLRSPLSTLFPDTRGFDAMRFDLEAPQEDEFAINALGDGSPYAFFGFPLQAYKRDGRHVFSRAFAEGENRWVQPWLRLLMKVQADQKDGNLVLKNPTHMARIKTLVSLFPKARFVHMVRHPYEVFGSMRTMMAHMLSFQAFQSDSLNQQQIDQIILHTLPELYRRYDSESHHIAEDRLHIVKHHDLARDPEGVLRTLYDCFSLERSRTADPKHSAVLESICGYTPTDHGLSPDEKKAVRDHWAEYAQRYGFEL
ncbi:MAG: sulfotransferase [Pseudomonadota bacterium]